MAVVQANDELLEEPSGCGLLKPPRLLNVLKQGAPSGILHRNAYVVVGQEDLAELYDMRMPQDSVVEHLCFYILCDLLSSLKELRGDELNLNGREGRMGTSYLDCTEGTAISLLVPI